MPGKFIDSVLMNSGGKSIKILPGMYGSLNFRFSGAQSGATAPTPTELGFLNIYYRNKIRSRIRFTELGVYNDKKYGARELVQSAGDTQAFSFNFKLPFQHADDHENIFYTGMEGEMRIEWVPDSALAARVSAASFLHVTGSERLGKMKYLFSWGRTEIAMVAGRTTPERILPYNIMSLFIEYDTDIDAIDLSVDGKAKLESAELVEVLNDDLLRNRIETYSASGYAEVDMVEAKSVLETLNSDVSLILNGSAADTISCFWTYADYQDSANQVAETVYAQEKERILTTKVSSGGIGAIKVASKLIL
ncbi:hypothetical protein [Flavobacterium sp.]|uniref:hypothetical protein n=1 Tax=Flavobacterium sp. TaxID=239 RepID=UPI002B4B1629|nr:hypothetical protein [Flavobacterium sp.]HLF51511.1 hypothetical protein [Flavobacterium sp.]